MVLIIHHCEAFGSCATCHMQSQPHIHVSIVVWIPLFLDPSDGVFGRFDLAALCGCRTLNFCLFCFQLLVQQPSSDETCTLLLSDISNIYRLCCNRTTLDWYEVGSCHQDYPCQELNLGLSAHLGRHDRRNDCSCVESALRHTCINTHMSVHYDAYQLL